MLEGDSARLQQILSNLVGNALKFTDSGSVEVEAARLPYARPGMVRVLFTVSDTGIGIREQDLERLFESFTQAESNYRRRHQGAGLGLAIVKRLVDLMGGSMDLESKPGKGSTFHVSLPFAESQNAACRMPGRQKKAPAGAVRVLLAEDDAASQFTTLSLLDKLGYAADAVEDGERVLELLREKSFDLVLMDVQMPIMDGVEATRKIRAGEAGTGNAAIPIVALTAYAMSGDRERFLEAGMNAYLPKPVDLTALDAVLRLYRQRRLPPEQ
ncbi:MAG: ATP-binding protein, partial [Desulfovibrionaceae bacterium]